MVPTQLGGSRSEPAPPDSLITLQSISALGTHTSDAFHAANNLTDLLRSATRHVRRLVGARMVRIWITRAGGRRLVGHEFPADGEQAPVVHRRVSGEGLAGYAISRELALRLGPGDPRPELRGAAVEFHSALVVPLFRRAGVFGAIECLDKQGEESFSAADFDRLEVASEHVAFALDNALLYEETERRALEKEVLLEVSKTLAKPLDLDEVIEAIFRSLHQVVDYDAAAIYLVNRETRAIGLVSQVNYPPVSDEALELTIDRGIVGWVAQTGEPVIVPDVRSDGRYVEARPETRSELAAPLLFEGRTIGVFNLESDLVDAYHEGHLEFVRAFAAQAAVAVERARLTRELLDRRRLEKELAIAREIQLSFLPKAAPEVPGYELAGTTMPHDEVGGDYYDFIRVTDHRIGLAIADVSGKGIPAALIMAGFRMSLLAEIRNEFTIRAVMRKVNSLVHESTDRERFVTAFYGVLDSKNNVLIFSNAGHNPPILLRRDGSFETLSEGGVALGVLPDARYEERPVALRPGDLLVMYTDGVSESESASGEHFGTQRIEQTMARLADRGAQAVMEGLIEAVREWSGERGPSDDLTLLVVKMRNESA